MKRLVPITLFAALAGWSSAEEAKPQIAGPCKEAPAPEVCEEGPQIVRPIGRVPLENAKPQTEAIPDKYAEDKAVAIKFENLEPVGERVVMQATLRIINPTDAAITFTGYSELSPITKEQHWKDGKWVDEEKFLKCGTGLRQCTIAPGQSAVFKAAVYPQNMPTRIGLNYSHGDRKEMLVAWSEKISDR